MILLICNIRPTSVAVRQLRAHASSSGYSMGTIVADLVRRDPVVPRLLRHVVRGLHAASVALATQLLVLSPRERVWV